MVFAPSKITRIRWAPRVRRETIFRLYEQIAQGILDQALIDDVAYAFYARCQDMKRIAEQRVVCPTCGYEFPHPHPAGQPLRCAHCDWQVAWRDYFAAYQGKQFMAPTSAVEAYLQGLPRCVTPRDKLLLIDALIHECHKGLKRGDEQLYTRPVAVNLIQGSMNEVIAFLENLPYGPASGPEMEARLATWRRRCLNQMPEMHKEWRYVQGLVDALPGALRREVEALVAAGQHQRAAARLAEIKAYQGELDLLPGDVPREMVKVVAREIRKRQRTNDAHADAG
jgi:predicted Zn-ribbon and HTH transcriptional regulator